MKQLRLLLFPFGILLRIVTGIRNFFYDKGIFKSYMAPIPVIVVGNLSVGGTGKSPQIEYLIRLLSDLYSVATLSRGYKRKTEGFILADSSSKVEDLGDEPFQFFSKFKNIKVAVDTSRKNGIQQLLQLDNPPQVILLDDAYQHRKVKATAYILLTAYGDLYCDDFVLPTGNLRESRKGADRAKIIIVTKCPAGISDSEKNQIASKLNINKHQSLFFTTISYDDFVYSTDASLKVSEIQSQPKIILAGIAKPQPFFEYLKNPNDLLLEYPDHHNFSDSEIQEIKQKSNGKIIITTEKDYARIKDKFSAEQLFYLPIKTKFLGDQQKFNQLISDTISNFN